ncbi:glycosyltransferase [Pseudomonas sp. NPDC087639]|uniref:glycosyltransferase n=1 Tax=Pseudomonas sp. NPDC087639 TaxID=3364445 RepID=UPI0037F9762D
MSKRQIKVGWCVSSLSLDIASVRYRALLPLLALEKKGFICRLFSPQSSMDLEGLDALVIVKTFSMESLALIQRARALGIPVIIDLCDNVFVPGYGKSMNVPPGEMLVTMAQYASAIVTTTEPLAEVVRAHAPNVAVHVIPDGLVSDSAARKGAQLINAAKVLEGSRATSLFRTRLKNLLNEIRDSGSIFTAKRLLKKQIHRVRKKRGRDGSVATVKSILRVLWRKSVAILNLMRSQGVALLSRIKRHLKVARPEAKQPAIAVPAAVIAMPAIDSSKMYLLWFGNHGADYADFGILDLLLIREALETIALEYPVELVVISNNKDKYEKMIKPMAIASRYVEWSISAVDQWMAVSDVVLIPNSCDPFSVCKSANRTVHALMCGIPVVATATPGLAPLAGGLATDDFLIGMRRYLSDKKNGLRDIALAKKLIDKHFSAPVIGDLWAMVLQSALAEPDDTSAESDAEIVVVLHLIQDLDLALPIVLELKQRGIPFQVICSHVLLKASPRVMKTFAQHGINIRVLPATDPLTSFRFGPRTKALLSVSETNLSPHRFTRSLTEAAKAIGIMTATLQHGLENVGLTYSDKIQSVDRVNFAADKIYLWGGLDTLHPEVSNATRMKCVPIGCPKINQVETADLSALIDPQACVVGVFENLHWHRYSEDYRQFFLDGVTALAERFPDVIFLIKPHHAGLWLTSRYQGEKPVASNLIIADPKQAQWERYTAGGLLGRVKAVITSPSTVALDAAMRGLPVAVVTRSLETETYNPLFAIEQMADWSTFVERVLDHSHEPELEQLSERFARRMVLQDEAAAGIVDNLVCSTSLHSQVTNQ